MTYSYTTSFNPNNNANPKRNISMEVPVRTITQFSDLPSCLVIEILLRLPTQTLLICRFVCMDWFRLFCNPYFIKLHLAASPIHYLDRRFLRGTNFVCERILDDDAGHRTERLDFPLKLIPDELAKGWYWCTNSCNGLVCLQSQVGVFVANPVLGELVIIPLPPRIRSGESSLGKFKFVLGFSAKTNQYKVMYGFRADFGELGIYTLGSTGEWRIINDDQTLIWASSSYLPHLHGSLHWADSKRHMIYAFDVENEKLKRFSLPRPRWLKQDSFRKQQIGIINGYLCVVMLGMMGAEIWAMKEYGIEKSWTLMHACMEDCSKYLSKSAYEVGRFPLVFPLNEDKILITSRYQRTVSLNLRILSQWACDMELSRTIVYNPSQWACDMELSPTIVYNPSFVSLHDVAKGEQVMVSRLADSGYQLLFPLNEEETLIASDHGRTVSLNHRRLKQRACYTGRGHSIGYNPSFVSLHDVAKGEQVMVSRLADSGLITEERSEEESENISCWQTAGRRRRRRPIHPLSTRQLADMTSTRGICWIYHE